MSSMSSSPRAKRLQQVAKLHTSLIRVRRLMIGYELT